MSEHECVFVEEQEPSGRLILPPCIVCDLSAMDALEQLRDETSRNCEACPFPDQVAALELVRLREGIGRLVGDWQANGNSRPLGDRTSETWHECAQALLALLDDNEGEGK
jgi:hypothetical protein